MKKTLFIFLFVFPLLAFPQYPKFVPSASPFFQWHSNPVRVALGTHKPEHIVLKTNNGNIKIADAEYFYYTEDTSVHNTCLYIGLIKRNKIQWVDSICLAVQPYPNPWLMFAYHDERDTTISKTDFRKYPVLMLPLPNTMEVVINLNQFKIISFNFRITRNDSTIFSETNTDTSGRFYTDTFVFAPNDTLEQYHSITSEACYYTQNYTKSGDLIIFDNITAVLFNKEKRALKPLRFILKD